LNTQNVYLKLLNTTGAFSDIYVAKVFFQYQYFSVKETNLLNIPNRNAQVDSNAP